MPTVLIDWADLRIKRRLMVLRASVAVKGGPVTLYERTITFEEYNTATTHKLFLDELEGILPYEYCLLLVTDARCPMPDGIKEIIANLYDEYKALQIKQVEARLSELLKAEPLARKVMEIHDIGLMTAVLLIAKV